MEKTTSIEELQRKTALLEQEAREVQAAYAKMLERARRQLERAIQRESEQSDNGRRAKSAERI